MIKPHDLIIGSWIMVPITENQYHWSQVIGISEDHLIVDALGEKSQLIYEQLRPILISKIVLVKFGFRLADDGIWYHEVHPISIKEVTESEWNFPSWPLLGATYLHELQFIFAFLCGTQMDISL